MPPSPLTGGREVAAFAIAQALRIAAAAAAAPYYLPALYRWALDAGGPRLISVVSWGPSLGWAILGFILFLVLRRALAEAPPGSPGLAAGHEVGAYALAQGIGLAAGFALFAMVMPPLYARFGLSGRPAVLYPLSLAISVALTALVFLLFVHLRRSFARPGAVPRLP